MAQEMAQEMAQAWSHQTMPHREVTWVVAPQITPNPLESDQDGTFSARWLRPSTQTPRCQKLGHLDFQRHAQRDVDDPQIATSAPPTTHAGKANRQLQSFLE